MRRAEHWRRALAALLFAGSSAVFAQAASAPAPPATTPAAPQAQEPSALDLQVQRISAELRCLVCQNQTIADSHADLAVDLRRQVRELLQQGKSEREVLAYMTARYGDFVLYRPPVKETTWLPWFGPALLLAGGAVTLIVVLRRRARMPAEAFDADEGESEDTRTSAAPQRSN